MKADFDLAVVVDFFAELFEFGLVGAAEGFAFYDRVFTFDFESFTELAVLFPLAVDCGLEGRDLRLQFGKFGLVHGGLYGGLTEEGMECLDLVSGFKGGYIMSGVDFWCFRRRGGGGGCRVERFVLNPCIRGRCGFGRRVMM